MENEFEGKEALPGLEHLGRAIVDENGVPSGSPANFENLRGRTSPGFRPQREAEEIIAQLRDEFPPEE